MKEPGNCPICKGQGSYLNSFSQVRRCGTCRGTGNAPAHVIREHVARAAVFAELDGMGRGKWHGRSAYGHLRDHEPARFERLLASVESGRVRDVAVHLIRHYQEMYPA